VKFLNYEFAIKLKVCLKMDIVGVLMIDSNSSERMVGNNLYPPYKTIYFWEKPNGGQQSLPTLQNNSL